MWKLVVTTEFDFYFWMISSADKLIERIKSSHTTGQQVCFLAHWMKVFWNCIYDYNTWSFTATISTDNLTQVVKAYQIVLLFNISMATKECIKFLSTEMLITYQSCIILFAQLVPDILQRKIKKEIAWK